MQEVSEKLGEDKTKQMDDLFGFNSILNNELSKDSCSDEMRKMISDKMIGIKKAIDRIQDVTEAKHFSPDTKAKLISEVLESVNLEALKGEISGTKSVLQSKMKSIARNTKDRIINSINALESSIQDNIRFVKEEKARAIKESEELNKEAEELVYIPRRGRSDQDKLKDEKNLENEHENVANDKEVALALCKEKGFFSTFRKIWGDRETVGNKKIGFFGVLKETCIEYYYNRDDAKANKMDAVTLGNLRIDLDNKIGKCEERIRALNKQLKDVKKECGKVGKDCLGKCKSRLDSAVQPFTMKDRYEELGRKVEEFSKTLDRITERDR